MITSNLGYPRVGPDRELKRAVEAYWKGRLDADALRAAAAEVRLAGLRRQAALGIDLIPSNDFAFYDHVLDHVVMFGLIPDGYGWSGGPVSLATYFALARGSDDAPALEMTKWFNTNYHYISAVLTGRFELTENRPLAAWQAARATAGLDTKPVLIGPYTFLKLANNPAAIPLDRLLDALLPHYRAVLAECAAAGVGWLQLDEPALVQDVSAAEMAAVEDAYRELARGPRPRVLLQTYFDDVAHIWARLAALPVDGFGLDFVHGRENLDALEATGFPSDKVLGIGIVDGRNVWRTDLAAALEVLNRLASVADLRTAHLQPSSSVLHLPHTASAETALDPAIQSWLAFADERLEEVALLRRVVDGATVGDELAQSGAMHAARLADPRTRQPAVRARIAALGANTARREPGPVERRALQQAHLHLPPLPTTTIGSFPQTPEVRIARARHARGELSDAEYAAFLDAQYRSTVALQEELGLDVLVHGEFERSDMVDYFAQQLDGMAFIESWVQSYGTRCVRPPLIFGDVSRPRAMTVDTIRQVQALTQRPVKGMLTGPVTMLNWSFARDDLERGEIALQLALAIGDEVRDLEAAGIRIIQIDEPALREGLPLQEADWDAYLDWATRAFRVAAAGVAPSTQIHTHMCYSEFNAFLPAVEAMDADVVSIEDSRSGGELLSAFREYTYARGIGPGVYDVHSERVPSVDEMAGLLRRSAAVIDLDLLWVNPDCGLKTRGWDESVAALRNMVAAAHHVRSELLTPA
jgi:5-methyltetrahydropteroyltriglutamate--homocysteine methyltransferase